MSHRHKFRWVEGFVSSTITPCLGLVFICASTSFATVMALGMGQNRPLLNSGHLPNDQVWFRPASRCSIGAMARSFFAAFCIYRFRNSPVAVTLRVMWQLHTVVSRDSTKARCWDGFWILFVIACGCRYWWWFLSGINWRSSSVLTDSQFWNAFLHPYRWRFLRLHSLWWRGLLFWWQPRFWRIRYQTAKRPRLNNRNHHSCYSGIGRQYRVIFLLLRSFTDAFSFAFWVVSGGGMLWWLCLTC